MKHTRPSPTMWSPMSHASSTARNIQDMRISKLMESQTWQIKATFWTGSVRKRKWRTHDTRDHEMYHRVFVAKSKTGKNMVAQFANRRKRNKVFKVAQENRFSCWDHGFCDTSYLVWRCVTAFFVATSPSTESTQHTHRKEHPVFVMAQNIHFCWYIEVLPFTLSLSAVHEVLFLWESQIFAGSAFCRFLLGCHVQRVSYCACTGKPSSVVSLLNVPRILLEVYWITV